MLPRFAGQPPTNPEGAIMEWRAKPRNLALTTTVDRRECVTTTPEGHAYMDPSVLVVDDNELYRTAFCRLVQLCWPAAQIGEAADASQTLALFPQQTWDLIILDYQLPTLSGTDLARHLRTRAQAQGRAVPPIVLMSTHPDAATFARSCGAVTFLPKPVDIATLRTA